MAPASSAIANNVSGNILRRRRAVLNGVANVGAFVLYESILSPQIKSLVWLITAREFDCEYEWDAAVADARNAGIGMSRGAGRVKLDPMDMAAELGARNLFRRGVIGEVKRHQRLELEPIGQLAKDAIAVVQCQCSGSDGRLQVRHHHRARKTPCGIGEHRRHCAPIAQMNMEVVRAPEGDAIHLARFYLRPPFIPSSALR